MFYPHSRPLTRAVHSLEHLATLSDAPSLSFCLSERTAYILQNLAVLDAVDSRRYARLINPYGYVPVQEGDDEYALFQSTINNLCLELIGGECQQVKSHVCANTAIASVVPSGEWTAFPCQNVEYDLLGEYDAVNYLFRASEAGIYEVKFTVLFSPTTAWGVGEIAAARLVSEFAGGCTPDFFHVSGTGFSQYVGLRGAVSWPLATDEAIQLEILQQSGGSLALFADAAYNAIWIDRLV